MKRIDELKALIREHERLYTLGTPTLSDSEFDALYLELKALEGESDNDSDSPTKQLGVIDSSLKTHAHLERMGSLNNIFSTEELSGFLSRVSKALNRSSIPFTIEPKFDGIALNLRYHHGVLDLALTRGDGFIGEDITPIVKQVSSIPSTLSAIESIPYIEIRGELLIHKSQFKILNETIEHTNASTAHPKPLFSNARNAAAGIVRSLQPDPFKINALTFYAYGVGDYKPLQIESQYQLLLTLGEWGFNIAHSSTYCKTLSECIAIIEHMEVHKDTLDYDIDGMVIKIDNNKDREGLGYLYKSPVGAIAYKFKGMSYTTTLKAIEVSIGRTGILTPVALIEPVSIKGVVVSRVTLHNFQLVKENNLNIGDRISIIRSGEVIPKFVGLVKKGENVSHYPIPEVCPYCQHPTIVESKSVRCINPLECTPQLKRVLRHFCSRSAFNIQGLGEQWIDKLIEYQYVKDPSDLFILNEETLLTLDRMGRKLALNILKAIDQSKSISLEKFLYSLGIQSVGHNTARILALEFKTLDQVMSVKKETLMTLKDIGETAATDIETFFTHSKNKEIVAKLLDRGVRITPPTSKGTFKLSGLTYAITGSVIGYKREDIKQIVEFHGGKFSSTLSKNVDYLIIGNGGGSKLEKAQSLGIKVINPQQFFQSLD